MLSPCCTLPETGPICTPGSISMLGTLPDLEEVKPAAPVRQHSLCRYAACTKAVPVLAVLILCSVWRPTMATIVWAVVVQNDLPTASEMMQQLINSHCTNGAAVSFAPDEVLPWAPPMCAAHVEVHHELLAYESTVESQASPPFGAVDPGQTHLVRGGCWRTLWLLVCGRETVVAADFPRTFGLLRSTPATTAMVSILQPGCSIGSHQGENKAVLR